MKQVAKVDTNEVKAAASIRYPCLTRSIYDLVEWRTLQMKGFGSESKVCRQQMCLDEDDSWIKQRGVGRIGR